MDPQSIVALHTGRHMPVMGLGSWQLTKDKPGTVATALDLDYRMIDTSGDCSTQPRYRRYSSLGSLPCA